MSIDRIVLSPLLLLLMLLRLILLLLFVGVVTIDSNGFDVFCEHKKNGALASGRGDMHEREVKCFILKTKVGLVGGER